MNVLHSNETSGPRWSRTFRRLFTWVRSTTTVTSDGEDSLRREVVLCYRGVKDSYLEGSTLKTIVDLPPYIKMYIKEVSKDYSFEKNNKVKTLENLSTFWRV